jgi:aminopeptidase N
MPLACAIVPTHYDIALSINLSDYIYEGTVTISFKINTPSPFAELNAESTLTNLCISQAGRPVTHTRTADVLRLLSDDFTVPITLTFTSPIRNDDTGICTYFPSTCSTQFEAEFARRAFPCFDEPCVRSTFSLTLTVPSDLTAVSNAPLLSRTVASGCAVHLFDRTLPIPVYLFAFAVDAFECESVATTRGLPVRVYFPAGQSAADGFARTAAAVIDRFEDYFGLALPLAAMHIAGVRGFPWIGMENFGLITVTPEYVASPEPGLIAHEIVHHWAGDLTTPATCG